MAPEDFRRLALSLPETVEAAHMSHPDFRVGGKVFASLGAPDAAWGMVKLAPEEQELRIEAEPAVFRAAKGAWGRCGYTSVRLDAVSEASVASAMRAAWLNTAPKRLRDQFSHGRQDRSD
jgi:hypothetical protein